MKKIIFLMILVISSFNFACANEDNLNLTIKEKMPKANFSKQDSIKTNKLFIDYLREIEINIQRNWIPPVENKSQRVVVRLTIGKDGKILDTKILRTESEKANKQALLALEKTTFLPLPKEYNGDTVEILFNFDNNFVKAISARNSSQNSKTPSNATEILYMSIDWAPYIRNIENKIKSNWKPVKKERSTRTVAEYTINKKGELLNTKIIQSSGADEVDEQALLAIKNSAPFEPLPQEYTKDTISILFTFDYNVMNSSKEHYNYAQETKFARSIREYKEQVQGKITKTYSKEQPLLNKEDIKVSIEINKHGEITNYKLIKSSQNEKINEQALNIIKKASPFGILTAETNTETINVNYTFRKQP